MAFLTTPVFASVRETGRVALACRWEIDDGGRLVARWTPVDDTAADAVLGDADAPARRQAA